MPKTSRRHIARLVGASCLAATFTLPGVTAAAAGPDAVAGAVTATPAEPTPPPPPSPPDPPPQPPPQPPNPPPETPPPADTQPATPPSGEPPPSDVPPPPDGTTRPEESGELKAEVEQRAAQAPEEVRDEVTETLTRMMDLIEDPDATPEERATYVDIVGGITSTLKAIQDPDVTPEDRAAFIRIVKAMTAALYPPPPSPEPPQSHAPQGPKWLLGDMGKAGAGLKALHDPQSTPEDPEDRKRVQKTIEQACDAMRTARDPEASREEREEALRKVKQRIEALSNAQYLALMKEIKRYKPSSECVETVENRTRQVGWADGSLWGLTDPSCAAALAAGASQESTRWHALWVCVQRDPFSSCMDHIPED